MSKKKRKPAAKKAPRKKAVKKGAVRSRALATLTTPSATAGRTKTATIFVFETAGGTKIRTSPQRVYANPGDSVEFNVVNMIDDSDVEVTIEFPGGGPWGAAPFKFRNWERKGLVTPPEGRFKYVVRALGAEEDPEVEIPEGPP
jgi:hypothetical protein